MHSLNIAFVGGVNPFFGCLLDFILYLPLGSLGFVACSDVLNVGHNTIHDGGLSSVRCWTLRSKVTGLVALEAGHGGRVASVIPIWGGCH